MPRNLWDSTTLTDAGTPITEMTIAHPDDRLVDVLASMASPDGRLVVVDPAGRLVGIVSPSDVTAACERRSIASPERFTT